MEHLSELERNILQTLQVHLSSYEKVNLDELAAECHVANSTVVKLAKKLGYSGYVEMYYRLFSGQEHRLFVDAEDFTEVIRRRMEGQLQELCSLLHERRTGKMPVMSYGKSDFTKEYFARRLQLFDFFAAATYDIDMIRNPLLERGIFFMIDESGVEAEAMLEILQLAKREGYVLAVLSRDGKGPVPRMAQINVILEGTEGKTTASPAGGADFFAARSLVFIELLMETYSKEYLCREVEACRRESSRTGNS